MEYKALQKENQRLKTENEILKKRPPYSQKNNIQIVDFIQDNLTDYSVSQLCSALKFLRSTLQGFGLCTPNRRQEYEE